MKVITGDHVAIATETCRVIGTGTQMLTTSDIPTSEADTLDRVGELVESCDGFAGAHPERKQAWQDQFHYREHQARRAL